MGTTPTKNWLIRAWLETNATPDGWRATVTDLETRERHAFSGVSALVKFLARETRPPPERDVRPGFEDDPP